MEARRYSSPARHASPPQTRSQPRAQPEAASEDPLPGRPAQGAECAPKEQPVAQRVVYACTQCSKHDLQVSIVMKALVKMIEVHEDGYTDVLDEFDPIVRRLYLEKGYEENRKKPASGDRAGKKKVTLAKGEEESRNNGFVIRLPKLSEPELFGEPKARWSETYSICPIDEHTVGISGSEQGTLLLDRKDGRVTGSIRHNVSNIFNMVCFGPYQVYFEGGGKIYLFEDERKLAQPPEKFTPSHNFGSFVVNNCSRGVALFQNELYFLNHKSTVSRFDLNMLVKSVQNRRTYQAEEIPSGVCASFAIAGKYKAICLSETGVVTIVEFSKVVRQTGRLSEEEIYTIIKESDDKILAACYSERNRKSTFRLLGGDLRDLDRLSIEGQDTPISNMLLFTFRSHLCVLACSLHSTIRLFCISGYRLTPVVSEITIDTNVTIYSMMFDSEKGELLLAGGQLSEMRRIYLL